MKKHTAPQQAASRMELLRESCFEKLTAPQQVVVCDIVLYGVLGVCAANAHGYSHANMRVPNGEEQRAPQVCPCLHAALLHTTVFVLHAWHLSCMCLSIHLFVCASVRPPSVCLSTSLPLCSNSSQQLLRSRLPKKGVGKYDEL